MALSNIFNEPRREITETAFGLVVTGTIAAMWWFASDYVANVSYDPNYMDHGKLAAAPYPAWLLLCMVMTFFVMLIIWGLSTVFMLVTHAIGEGICNAMAKAGYDPRPVRNRF